MNLVKKLFLILFACALTIPGICQQKSYFSPDQIDIPYKKYVLDNGLTLIVHEDQKAPIVAVNIWYHVGSKNEVPGRTGFAHLFEHLMFNGSEHFNTDYFKALESIGATDLNGTTSNDRTNYFQNVPLAGLDQVLFLESDRMGHLVGVIDQARLDEQRGVVQNEKRQGENQPYGREEEIITKATYPKGHPYSWTVIGSMEDLNAASLDDVKTWFKTYYGPNNAVLCIAGDVNPEEILAKVKKYFGDIPPGPSLAKPQVNIAKMQEETRSYYEDHVPEARLTMVWNVPQWGSKDAVLLDLASSILSNGKSARLYKKLIYEDQISSSAYAYIDDREIAGNFTIVSTAKPGKSIEDVEGKINGIIKDLVEKGPSQEELDRVKATYFAGFLKGLERIGGFGGKSDILASNMVYGGTPDYYKTVLKYISEASVADIQRVCKEWLTNGKFVLTCKPFPNYKASGEGVDRSKLPELGTSAPATFPAIQKATLKNGLNVVLTQRKGIPTVVGSLIINAGYSTDILSKPGMASMSMDMLDEGTKSLNSIQISEKLQLLGASVNAGSDLDASYVNFRTLIQTLDPTLDIFADILLNPSFPQKEFDRLKTEHVDGIKREKVQPFGLAMRVFPKMLYGSGHPYSNPITGSGYEATIQNLTLEEVQKFYTTWIKPNNSTLVVVGDISMPELVQKLEAKIGAWKKGDVPRKVIPTVNGTTTTKIYLMDRPEATQSLIIGGYLTTPYGQVSQPALEAMNNILGGDFISRINMNIREDKHWSYGASSLIWDAKEQRPFLAYAPVQMDKTKETIQELLKELTDINSAKPISNDEYARVQKNMILQLPGMWETNNAVLRSLTEIVKFRLPEDYYKTYDAKVKKLSLDDLQQVSKQVVKPEQVKWFVVGDKSKILDSLKQLGYEIVEVDPDGNVLK